MYCKQSLSLFPMQSSTAPPRRKRFPSPVDSTPANRSKSIAPPSVVSTPAPRYISSNQPSTSNDPRLRSSSPVASISPDQPSSPSSLDISFDQSGLGIDRCLLGSAIDRHVFTVRFTPEDLNLHPDGFFNILTPSVIDLIDQLNRTNIEFKVVSSISVRFVQLNSDGTVKQEITFLFQTAAVDSASFDIDSVYHHLLSLIEDFIENGSAWVVAGVEYFDLDCTRYNSIPKFRGRGAFNLPPSIASKKAVLNINNKNRQDCFKLAVAAAVYDKEVKHHRGRAAKWEPFVNNFDWTGIELPMTAAQLKTFEAHNPTYRINLIAYRPKEKSHNFVVLYHTNAAITPDQKIVEILCIENSKGDQHYLPIINLDRLLSKSHNNQFHCQHCLRPFRRQDRREKHKAVCFQGPQQTLIPVDDPVYKFKKWGNSQRHPYVIYADIESVLNKTDKKGKMEEHIPIAFGCKLVASPDLKYPALPQDYKVFHGRTSVIDGINQIQKWAKEIYDWMQKYSHVPVIMTDAQMKEYGETADCYMCHRKFDKNSDPKFKKVIEHDHLTGQYRGAACQDCNTQRRLKRNDVPVFFHNLRGYDMHALCAEAFGSMKEWQLEPIAQSSEKYMALFAKFKVDEYTCSKTKCKKAIMMNIRFLDSCQFMARPLASLVANLENDKLRHCQALNLPSEKLYTSKGIFPYSYISSETVLDETTLPPIEAFNSSLTDEPIPLKDYNHALEMWQLLGCRSIRDYMLEYLKLDVHQLADVFENFRNLTLHEDGLDPVYYISLPGLTWDSAFKFTGASVELLTDPEMFQFSEKAIRGGMTFVNVHELNANSLNVPESFDDSKPIHDLGYVDANNLYGHALCQKLPQKNFRWLSDEEIKDIDVTNIDVDNDTGYFFEVDLSYPNEVQDRTMDLPFAPERLQLKESMMTPFMKEQWQRLMDTRHGNPNRPYRGYQKLMLTHYDRERYVVHGAMLKFMVQKGMVVTAIHRVMSFYQSAYFAPYIQYNSRRRQEANNEFERDFYKLKNNSLYGKFFK